MNNHKIVEKAPAKVNLYLEVTGRRANGYHDLDSLVVFADIGETLTAQVADEISLKINGPWAGALDGEADNLILRAAQLLKQKTGYSGGADFTLEKHIPVAAGVGGGSADAAAALRVLNKLWHLGLSEDALCAIGLELGADVPVCVRSRTSRFLGIGDELHEGPQLPKNLALVLINPRVAVRTKDVFSAVRPSAGGGKTEPSAFEDLESLKSWLLSRRNDLEGPAMGLADDISSCLAALKENAALSYVAMSGSGATCFALCEDIIYAKSIVPLLIKKHPNWWVQACEIL